MAKRDTERKTEKDYEASDLAHVFRQGQFSKWGDVIAWLKRHGMDDNELTPGETERMLSDLQRLQAEHRPFTTDPEQVYELAKGHPSRK